MPRPGFPGRGPGLVPALMRHSITGEVTGARSSTRAMAMAHFTCVHLGREARLRIPTHHVHDAAKRISGIAESRLSPLSP